MKVCHTFSFRVEKPNKKKGLDLNQTMRQYRRCVNFYLHEIAKGTEKQDIYKQARTIFNLPSALVQTARDFAQEQYKSWKNNPNNKTFPHFDILSQNTYIWLVIKSNTISINIMDVKKEK